MDAVFQCPQCSYDLRGSTKNRCPECGIQFKVAKLPSLSWPGAAPITAKTVWGRLIGLPVLFVSFDFLNSVWIFGSLLTQLLVSFCICLNTISLLTRTRRGKFAQHTADIVYFLLIQTVVMLVAKFILIAWLISQFRIPFM